MPTEKPPGWRRRWRGSMTPRTFSRRRRRQSSGMGRRFHRDRSWIGVAGAGLLIVLVYGAARLSTADGDAPVERLLTGAPWSCDVFDPEDQRLVARSVEIFHDGGRLEGRTILEDRTAGRVLLEVRYQGVWEFDDPWLTEAIRYYDYLQVDESLYSPAELAAIEAEFAEPERSRVHALSEGQLVYGAERSLYQCHRQALAASV